MYKKKNKGNEYGITCAECEEVIDENDYFFVNMPQDIDSAIVGDIGVVCDDCVD